MKLSSIQKKRFTYQDIWDLEPEMNYEELAYKIKELCDKGLIAPINKKKKTSFLPNICIEYRKIEEKQDYSKYESEIRSLHPKMNLNGYLEKPEEYVKNRDAILLLSDFLWKKGSQLNKQMSIKERSYSIWFEEKYLEEKGGRQILRFNHISEESLNFYHTPEPFFYTKIAEKGAILIVENKDPWYSIKKALKQKNTNQFCGVFLSLLLYGEGTKITREEALTNFLREEESLFWKEELSTIYYVGDIDIAGINLFYGVAEHNKELSIVPFLPLYTAYVKQGRLQIEAGIEFEPTQDKHMTKWNRDFLKFFKEEDQYLIEKLLSEQRRIPQEILSLPDYLEMCVCQKK